MLFPERGRLALICLTILMILTLVLPASAVETGPVDRKWGLGWANGLTARLWLKGVWELSLSAGPDDNLSHEQKHYLDSGRPPQWEERETYNSQEEKRESGFVDFQAGRLITRRGPLAAVGYVGLKYYWADSGYTYREENVSFPDDSYNRGVDYDTDSWTLTLGLRPSFVVLDFLTIETAFALGYRWSSMDRVEWSEYPATGRVSRETFADEDESFFYDGWSGMGSLQFMVWF